MCLWNQNRIAKKSTNAYFLLWLRIWKNTDASFCFTVDSRQNTNAFLVFSGKCNERHIRVFSSGYPMIQKNTQKNTKKTHPRHRCSKQFGSNTKGIESTLAWELWLHQQLVALQQHQPCRKKNIKTLRPTQNPDTEPIHAKNNRFHSKMLIFDNYPKSKTKKLTLLTCSSLFHNFNPNSYNSRYKSITKL